MNFQPGEDVDNLAQVQLGSDGRFQLFVAGSATNVVVDLQGYYVGSGSAASFTPVTGTRIADTRSGSPLAAFTPTKFGLRGVGPIPNDPSVTAVALDVTVLNNTSVGNLRVYPSDQSSVPNIATANYQAPAAAVENLAIAKLSADGAINLYSNQTASSDHVDVVVDVVGYYKAPPAPSPSPSVSPSNSPKPSATASPSASPSQPSPSASASSAGDKVAGEAIGYKGYNYQGRQVNGKYDYWGDANPPHAWCEYYLSSLWSDQSVNVPDEGGSVLGFSRWAEDAGRWTIDISHPHVGDAIVYNSQKGPVSSPKAYSGTSFDHAGIIEKVNADGTVVENDGDFGGGGDITKSTVLESSSFTPDPNSTNNADSTAQTPEYIIGYARVDGASSPPSASSTSSPSPSSFSSTSPSANSSSTPALWGVDSVDTVPNLYSTVQQQSGTPDAWGRYLTGSYAITNSEIMSVKNNYPGLKLWFVDNDYTSTTDAGTVNGQTSQQRGAAAGQSAAAAAQALSLPSSVRLFLDVEPTTKIDSGFLQGWYNGVTQNGYLAGYYGDPASSGSFPQAYCSAAASNSSITANGFVWAPGHQSQSSKTQAPAYNPDAFSSCQGHVEGWQYYVNPPPPNNTTPNVDEDEVKSDFGLYAP